MTLTWNPRTKAAADQFAANPGHALLITGQLGAGKPEVAKYIARKALGVERLDSYPYFKLIQPLKNSISIDDIRGAQDFVRLKTAGQGSLRRVIIVEDAHYLTLEAQNAFLKLLEEPPADTLIILTVNDLQALLPTIISRTWALSVQSPPRTALEKHFAALGYQAADIQKAYFIGDGQPGLMSQLLQKRQDDYLLAYIDLAKSLLSQTVFNRLVAADQLLKQKIDLGRLLWAMQRVSNAALGQAAQKNALKQAAYWQLKAAKILAAQEALKSNPQGKLLLTDLLI